MKRTYSAIDFMPVILTLLMLGIPDLSAFSAEKAPGATEEGKGPCLSCHEDLTAVLSAAHPPIEGNVLQSCMACHTPEERGVATPGNLAVRIHRTHLQDPVKMNCFDCHSWEPGKSFGLLGTKESYGAPTKDDLEVMTEILVEEMTSTRLGARHVAKGVGCVGCHGRDIAGTGGVVDNAGCLGCHGPVEELIVKTTPRDFPDRNPHNSHLGTINCTVCHAAHGPSRVYCLECHPKFEMKMR